MTLEKKAFIIPIFGIFYQSDTHKKKPFLTESPLCFQSSRESNDIGPDTPNIHPKRSASNSC